MRVCHMNQQLSGDKPQSTVSRTVGGDPLASLAQAMDDDPAGWEGLDFKTLLVCVGLWVLCATVLIGGAAMVLAPMLGCPA